MNGEVDYEYVEARRVLLDALEALGDHLRAVILVGAQAVYLYTGETSLAVPPHTTDADLALDPDILGAEPALQELMQQAGFSLKSGNEPGIWRSEQTGTTVDLLVPEAVSGKGGTRGARIEGHSKHAARKTRGLEGALVDKQAKTIKAFESGDERQFEIFVAGPSALLVAKLTKIGERLVKRRFLDNKDALDVYRLLQAVSTEEFVSGLTTLNEDSRSAEVMQASVSTLDTLFSTKDATGARMAAEALLPLADFDEVSQSCAFLAGDLLSRLRETIPELF